MGLEEGEVGTGTGSIEYSSVTSCLTVTCLLEDGTTVGGHLSLMTVPGKLDSSQVLPEMVRLIAGRKVTTIVIAGELDTWSPALLDVPLVDQFGNSTYQGQPPAYDVSGAVASRLGALDARLPDPEQRSNTFTITPT